MMSCIPQKENCNRKTDLQLNSKPHEKTLCLWILKTKKLQGTVEPAISLTTSKMPCNFFFSHGSTSLTDNSYGWGVS